MDKKLLAVSDLRIDYAETTAVRDVSFTVEAGMVYGLIGPNGAGKTSIMRAIANLVEPTYGVIRIAGTDMLQDPRRALARLGYMPDFPPVYADLTVVEFLELFAASYGIERSERRARIHTALRDTDLEDASGSFCGGLSRGMKQRLFVAKTLVHDPDVLVLDEPASGLDPEARAHLADTLRRLGEAGKAVLVSSHILSELDGFCNSVGIMDHGRMTVSGRLDAVMIARQLGQPMRVTLAGADDRNRLTTFLKAYECVECVATEAAGATATFTLNGDRHAAARLLSALVAARFEVSEFVTVEQNLQDLFMDVRHRREELPS